MRAPIGCGHGWQERRIVFELEGDANELIGDAIDKEIASSGDVDSDDADVTAPAPASLGAPLPNSTALPVRAARMPQGPSLHAAAF